MDEAVLWAAREDVELLELDGGFTLFDGTTGLTIFLNRTASQVLSLADGHTDVAAMTSLLAQTYGVTPEEIADDVRSALDALAAAGAVRQADA
jgi:Ethanolamine utilization protein EutJ (predicted chaperonin)